MVAEGMGLAVDAEADLRTMSIAGSVAEALDACRSEAPDLAIVDLRLPDGDGAECTRRILEVSPDCRVVMITAAEGAEVVDQAIEAGCVGFVRKTGHVEEVLAALRAARKGEAHFSGDMLQGVIRRLRDPRPSMGWDLTERELDVLRGLARGGSSEEIATSLFISHHTARNHIRNLLAKLGAHSQLQAVVFAVRENILGPDEVG